jgi:sugar O-acyltransferase (sialic acid O-acetyltransferase NeuD family)
MIKLAIIGSGDLAKLIIHHAKINGRFDIVGIFDDFTNVGTYIDKIKVIGTIDNIIPFYERGIFEQLMVGVGYSRLEYRELIFNTFSPKIKFANIIHSSCIIDPSVKIGQGVFLFPSCVLDSGVVIGDNVLLNVRCTIAHDSLIKAHSFLGPCVNIAGFTTIEKGCHIGINTTIIEHINIISGTRTGAGTVIIENIIKRGLYVGVPAKRIKDI